MSERPVVRIEIEMTDFWIGEEELDVVTEDDLIEMVKENILPNEECKFSIIWPLEEPK